MHDSSIDTHASKKFTMPVRTGTCSNTPQGTSTEKKIAYMCSTGTCCWQMLSQNITGTGTCCIVSTGSSRTHESFEGRIKQRGKFMLVTQHTSARSSINTWHTSQLCAYHRSYFQHKWSCYGHGLTSKTVEGTQKETCCILREAQTQNTNTCWQNDTRWWLLEKSKTRWQRQLHCDNKHK
jgi:hypothetical protein